VPVSLVPDGATIVAANDVLATEFGDEVVILNLRDGVYYGLEDVGTRIWQLLQQPVSVLAIREALVAEFDVEPARCERDIRLLLTDLAARGLVEIRGDV
jgi:sulfur transfer complex TusBCD TusB component (DsrH family)